MCVSSSGWAGYACLFQILRKVTHSLTEILSFASRFFFPWLNKWLRGACLGLCAGWCTLPYAGFLVKEKRQAPRRAVVCRCVSLTPCRGCSGVIRMPSCWGVMCVLEFGTALPGIPKALRGGCLFLPPECACA